MRIKDGCGAGGQGWVAVQQMSLSSSVFGQDHGQASRGLAADIAMPRPHRALTYD